MTPTHAARLMLLEDHVVVRDGIRALLESEPDLDVVHAIGSTRDALAMIPVVLPPLVLVDLNLPDVNGIEFLRCAASGHGHVRCVVLTSVGDAAKISEAVSAGARAVLGKTVSRDALIDVVRRVMRGESVQRRGSTSRKTTRART